MNVADRLNSLSDSAARVELEKCFAVRRWVDQMLAARPFADDAAVELTARQAAQGLSRENWLSAFAAHPRIGDVASLRAKFSNTASWAAAEQAGMGEASEHTIEKLASLNDDYFQRFGFIFIVCAAGKSAAEMLELIQSRLGNDTATEFEIASAEQLKITLLRLRKIAV